MCQKRNICSNLYLLIKKEKKLLPAETSTICYSVLQTKEIDNNDCNVRFLNKEHDYRIELQSRQKEKFDFVQKSAHKTVNPTK